MQNIKCPEELKMNGKKTFVKITNSDIYAEIKGLRTDLGTLREHNDRAHGIIISNHLNNRSEIKVIRWIACSALGIATFVSALLITGSL